MSFYLYRKGAFWEDEDGYLYSWDEELQIFRNDVTGEIAVPLAIESDEKVLVG